MPPVFPLVALLVTVVATGLVYADTVRRGLPERTRLRWTVLVLVVSLAGFAAAFVLDTQLARLYLSATGSRIVVQSPRELLTGLLLVGIAVSSAAVLAYGFGSRFGPFESTGHA